MSYDSEFPSLESPLRRHRHTVFTTFYHSKSISLVAFRRRNRLAIVLSLLLAAIWFATMWTNLPAVANAHHRVANVTSLEHERWEMSYNLFRAKALRANHRQARVHRHDFTFQTTSDELGALIGFLAAIGSNALPANLDPTETLNPDVVLEFNARSLHGAERVREHVQDVWAQYPVVILSEVGRGDLAELTRGVKRLFALYKLKPLPMMLDIDLRDDKRVLKPLLYRLTGLSSFPLILIGGHPILDVNSVFSLDKAGALAELLRTSGAIVGGSDARRKYE